MRSADAAKDTAKLIEGTVIKIKSGHEMVQKTNEEFKTVALTSRKVVDLNGEIAGASQEHFQGIRQNQVFPLEEDDFKCM